MAAEDQVNYCLRCGTQVMQTERFGKVRPVCPQCDWVYYADPKVAAAALVEQDGRVLLVRRLNEPLRGKWTLPAGFVDAGEDPARAAERECHEETGIEIRVTRLLDIRAGREHPRGADFIIFYRAEVVGGCLVTGSDVDQAGFFLRSDLPPLAFEATKYILKHFAA